MSAHRLGPPSLRASCCLHAVVMRFSSCLTFKSLRAVASYGSVSRALLVSCLRIQRGNDEAGSAPSIQFLANIPSALIKR